MLRLNKTFYKVPRNRNRRQTFQRFEVGEQVMSRFQPSGKKWYHGIVATVHTIEGLYDIQYSDGDFEAGVGPDRLQKIVEQSEDDSEEEEEDTVVESGDLYDTDNKKRCNEAIVRACQKYLSDYSIQALIIDAGRLNTTTCLVNSNIIRRHDRVEIINRDKKEFHNMVENMHELQKKCSGLLSLSAIDSNEFLSRAWVKNLMFLDYTQTLETIKRTGELEKVFKTGWLLGRGVFGITFSLRGSETRATQESKIREYLQSVVVGRKYALNEDFVHKYGQMIFLLFSVSRKL
jgi:hypothetical protein